ncbi:hypothetical protein MKX01_012980 [Papaver californicum]|nr:hypothetical protein MKX01_012980 [Papaver californicum]
MSMLQGRPLRGIAIRKAERAYRSVTFDIRGAGRSTGRPSRTGFLKSMMLLLFVNGSLKICLLIGFFWSVLLQVVILPTEEVYTWQTF